MTLARVNGVGLDYELQGAAGPALVLVHGSWDARHVWARVAPILAGSCRVVAYDRRGHGRSERPAGQGSVREDVADLAALIGHLDLAPAWVVANSFGASIALRLAGERPELVRGIVAHEPPLFSLLADDPATAPLAAGVRDGIDAVVERLAAGDDAGGAELFFDRVALGPGAWARLPAEGRTAIVATAATFLDEARDPEQFRFDLGRIAGFPRPVLFTQGGRSPPTYAPVIARLADVLPHAQVVTLPGAGHVPHVTHAADYARTILELVQPG